MQDHSNELTELGVLGGEAWGPIRQVQPFLAPHSKPAWLPACLAPLQISCVVVSKGHVHQGSGTPSKGSQQPQPQPQQSDEDSDVGGMSLEQQRAELAILMIMDLAQGPYKVRWLQWLAEGGVRVSGWVGLGGCESNHSPAH